VGGVLLNCVLESKHKRNKMKRHLTISILTVCLSLPGLANEYGSSRQVYLPRLADLMIETQLRHFKLWYAGHEKNWALADFELEQIIESFDNAARTFPTIPLASSYMMLEPASELDSAIKEKDSEKFVKAFDKLTAACNGCHEAASLGFIVIRAPTMSTVETSLFSGEVFSPR
jgi:hypothetical protein